MLLLPAQVCPPEIASFVTFLAHTRRMATKRNPQPDNEFGPRVVRRTAGRPVRGSVHSRVVADRVIEVKERLQLSWKEVAHHLGLNKRGLEARLYGANPTPFSAEELIGICDLSGARADYVLLGRGPMLRIDDPPDAIHSGSAAKEAAPTSQPSATDPAAADSAGDLAARLHRRLIEMVALHLDADNLEGPAQWLPDAEAALQAIEQAAIRTVHENMERHTRNVQHLTEAVMLATEAHFRARWAPADPTPERLKEATQQAVTGDVLRPVRRKR